MKNKFFVQKTKTTRATSTKNIPDIFIPLVLLVVFTGISPVFGVATNYYIAPWGSDSNSGISPQAPWKSITKCSNVYNPGTNCLIMPGEYYESFGVSNGALEETLDGTVECTHDSTVVTITGGTFSTDHVGFFIRCPGELGSDLINHRVEQFFPWTEIQAISPSGTSLTLVEPYRGPTATTTVAEVAKFYRYKGVDSSGNDTNNPEGVRIMAWIPETLTDPALVFTKYQGMDCPTCQNVFYFDLPATTELIPPLNQSLYTGIMQGPGPEGNWENVPRPFKGGMGQDFGTEPFFNWKKLKWIGTCDDTFSNLLALTDKWPGSYFIEGNRWYFNMRGPGEPTDLRSNRDWIYVGKYQGIHPNNAKYVIFENWSYYSAWAGGDDTPGPTAGLVFKGTCSNQDCGNILIRGFHHHGAAGGTDPSNYDIRNYSNFVIKDAKFFWGMRIGLGNLSGLYNVEIRRGTSNEGHAGGSTEANASTIDRVYVTSTITAMKDTDCTASTPDSYNFVEGPPIRNERDFGMNGLEFNGELTTPVRQYGYVINSLTEFTLQGFEFFTKYDDGNQTGRTYWLYNTGGRRYDQHSAAQTVEQRIWPDAVSAAVPGRAEIIGNALLNEKNDACLRFTRQDSYNLSTLDWNRYLDPVNRQGIVAKVAGVGKTFAQIRGDGKESNGNYHSALTLSDVFVDPEPDGSATDYTPNNQNANSPLIDTGETAHCPDYDLFGGDRTAGKAAHACDVGALSYDDPGEVTNLHVTRGPSGTLNLTYSPACMATLNNIYWRSTPSGSDWDSALCAIDNSGSYSGFDPGTTIPGAAKFFVIVAGNSVAEGSYGQSVILTGGQFQCGERAAHTGGCNGITQSANPGSWGCSVRSCP